MSRKDYEAIAAAFYRTLLEYPAGASAVDDMARAAVRRAAHHVAIALRQDNARFDTERFMQACGF